MIRVSLAMVKQAQFRDKGTSAKLPAASAARTRASRTSAAQAGRPSPPPLLPDLKGPAIARAERRSLTTGDAVDALLLIVPVDASRALFEHLPDATRWQDLHTREKPKAATVRTTTLSNQRQTLAVLGYLGAEASAFERLALAGRMLKETASRSARIVALATSGPATFVRNALEALLAATLAQAFELPAYRVSADSHSIRRIVLQRNAAGSPRAAEVDVPYALAAARGNNLVRWLTALPPNFLHAGSYRSVITRLARSHGLGMTWLGEKELRRAGANAFLAVSAANGHRDAGIAHLTYRPRRQAHPDIALIGKGILFDTGGVNLKTHRSMLDMHTDMSGSSVALATLLALAELRAPLAVDAWLAITENQIGPNAYRPQEVIEASNGVTIQVIHTDAEGRMVLADTLSLAGRTQPRLMLDFATLTGAAVYSLTERMSAVLTNRPELTDKLVAAGRSSGERVWNFPFDADYDSDLESKVADILQCSLDGKGDQILATRFLSRFVPEQIAWAHVDLSAATRPGGLGHINTDVTGFGVRYALELILKHDILADVRSHT